MMRHAKVAILLSCAATCGCAESRAYRLGRQAEQRGEPHIAYEHFCKAAAEHRTSGAVAEGLARVRPGAAAYWESQALLAMDQGNHADAWRMLMKALDIDPASRSTAQLIRQLESRHATEVADARSQWMRSGRVAVAIAQETPMRTLPEAPVRVDEAVPSSPGPTPPTRSAPSSPENTVIAASPKRETPPVMASKPDAETSTTEKPSRPPLRGGDEQFLAVQSLSLKGRTYPRSAVMVDGIEIRLRDTDDDLEADLDLYAGRTRVKKIREIKIGSSQAFTGVSGRLYRLTVLGIHHKSRTVRLGVRAS